MDSFTQILQRLPIRDEKRDGGVGYPIKILLEEALEKKGMR